MVMKQVQLASMMTALDTTTPINTAFAPRSGLWVQMRNRPSDYAFDQALLLCETFPGEWVAWIPSFGEITLTRGQFLQLAND